ncbi:MAG: DUF58 domain-containing protein [Desulfobacterales bacterium]|jgi:uncharacterized protein (DUF58 family)
MKIVPTYRFLFLVGLIFLPFSLLVVVVSSIAAPTIVLAVVTVIAVAMDAYRSQGRLEGIRVTLPKVLRISKGREGNFNLQIENQNLKARHIRLGLAFPKEIYTSAVELRIELPEDNPISSVDWVLTGLQQGRYHLDTCYLETVSLWGFWSVRRAVRINLEIRVYPNLFDERKNLSGLFLNKGLGIHTQRQVGKGRDFEQLREYLPGDSFEDIHWKTTAKRGEPITKVYQIERTQQIYVIIDASRLSDRSPDVNSLSIQGDARTTADLTTMLQRFITGALIMALAAERQGDLFGLLTFDDKVRSFLTAKKGKAHFNICRDTLYTLQPQSVSPDFAELFTFIGTKIRRRALLVFLTHLDDPVLADSFAQHIDLISRNHVILVNMLKPMVAKPLFSSERVLSVNDVYSELGGHLLWRRLQETQKVLQRRGVGMGMLDNENLCTELVSQYLTLKKRQVL